MWTPLPLARASRNPGCNNQILWEILCKEAAGAGRQFFYGSSLFALALFIGGICPDFQTPHQEHEATVAKAGIHFSKQGLWKLPDGKMSPEYVTTVLKGLPRGISEIYFHPALPSPSIPGEKANMLGGPAEARQRFKELSILIDPDLRSKIDQLGIVLSTYFDLGKRFMKTVLVVSLAVIAQATANTLLSKGMKVIASMPAFSDGFSLMMLAYALKSPFIWGGIIC